MYYFTLKCKMKFKFVYVSRETLYFLLEPICFTWNNIYIKYRLEILYYVSRGTFKKQNLLKPISTNKHDFCMATTFQLFYEVYEVHPFCCQLQLYSILL